MSAHLNEIPASEGIFCLGMARASAALAMRTLTTASKEFSMQSKFLQIKDSLICQIESGEVAAGGRLPREKELAIKFGVAVGTIRRALELLQRQGYIKRVRGRGTFVNSKRERLFSASGRCFALVVPQLRDGLYPSLIDGFEHGCTVACRQVRVCSSRNDLALQAEFLQTIGKKAVAGLAFVPTNHPLTPVDQIHPILDQRIPLVLCHRRLDGISAPLVTWSDYNVGCMAAETLLEKSHRRIAVLVSDCQDPSVVDLVRGMRQACDGVDGANPNVLSYGEQSDGLNAREAIRTTVRNMLAEENHPTAIFCTNLPHAERIVLAAEELGYKIPDDLSLMYFGDTWRESEFSKRLTCIAVDERDVGKHACDILVRMDSDQLPLGSDVRFEVALTFLPGQSVGQPRQSAVGR